MTDDSEFRRKLSKLRSTPQRFLVESGNPVLQALGTVVGRVWAGHTGLAGADPEKRRSKRKRTKEKQARGDVRELIAASGLFDAEYYLAKYPDVAGHDIDPLDHYILHGESEARSPNPVFDPVFYARQVGIEPHKSPLLHYIRKGEAKGHRPSARFDPAFYRSQSPDLAGTGLGVLAHYLRIGQREGRPARRASRPALAGTSLDEDVHGIPVTILIPVFDNGDHVRRCIDAVLAHTRLARAELLLIDDASTDPATVALLDEYARLPKITLLRNEENRGFTRTVNRGIEHARGRDVVLLNSDTIVGPRWLEHLALVAYGARRIATATALSDNSGAFSTPEIDKNPTMEIAPVHDVARLSARAAPTEAHFVPTGNGFCMYMRRDAIEATGLLDDHSFPRGYGEENDWCLRASERGWRHAIALRSYVHHVNAVSFGSEAKERLRRDARAVLDRLHPDYGVRIKSAFGPETRLTAQRAALRESLGDVKDRIGFHPRPRVCFVVSTRSGGTPLTNEDLMRGVGRLYEPLLLVCDSKELQIFDCSKAAPVELASHSLSERVQLMPHTSAEYDAVVASWLVRFGVELVHVRHIGWHGLGLPRTARRLGIPVVFSFHDFYAMCPSVNLTDGSAPWSDTGVVAPSVLAPLWANRDPDGVEAARAAEPRAFLDMWQRRMNAMLAECDAFVTTSPIVKTVLSKNLPVLRERASDFHVIPHGRDFARFLPAVAPPTPDAPLRVLLPGNVNEQKGLHTVLEILRLDTDGIVELHTIGNVRQRLREVPRVIHHGRYERADFDALVTRIAPHVGFLPTVCPETFCHTLTECWAAGLPVVGSDVGAVGERILESRAGWVVDPWDAVGILALFRRIRSGEEDWSAPTRALDRWRESHARWDVASMSEKYLDLYQHTFQRQRSLLPAERRGALRGVGSAGRQRIAVVVRGHFPSSRATSHVRIATPIGQASSASIDYRWIDAGELVRAGVDDFDGVIVCRNAAHPEVLSRLGRECDSRDVPLVLDLDDDLLNVPEEKDPRGEYAAAVPALRELLSVASLVTVSTPRLVGAYRDAAREVRLVPNRLDPRIWLAPLPGDAPPLELDGGPDTVRLIYMGSVTHREDLALILPAFERLRAEHDVTLHIVGVTDQAPPGVGVLTPPSPRYDEFATWFRTIARQFDIAVAPLVDTPFNRSKSALKFMEYAACGLPVVASRVEAYADVVRDGVDGLLVDEHPDAWVDALRSLVVDPASRARLGAAARRRAESELMCRSCVFDELPWAAWARRRSEEHRSTQASPE